MDFGTPPQDSLLQPLSYDALTLRATGPSYSTMQIRLTPDYSLLVVFAIFLVNYFVVRRFFVAPISRVMNERQQDIRSAEELYQSS